MDYKEIEKLVVRINQENLKFKDRLQKRESKKFPKLAFIVSPFIRALIFTTIVLIAYNCLLS